MRVTIERSRVIQADVESVWNMISDLGGYAEHVRGLAATTVLDGSGAGARRMCVDVTGATWEETCTVWKPFDSYTVDVDVSTYPSKFRVLFAAFAGTWSVEETAGGTSVSIRFDATLRRIPGRSAIARKMEAVVSADLDDILTSYQRGAVSELA